MPTTAQIEAAEALLGVEQTPGERALMREALEAQLAQAHQRRAFALPEATAPATRFDPRLPGFRPPEPGPLLLPEPAGEVPEDEAAIAFAPALSLRAWLRDGRLSAERLTDIYLRRIERIGPGLECWAFVDGERASERARALDRHRAAGGALGPLHGLPYGMKDIIDVAGLPCEWGAEPYAGRVAAADAHVTRLLHDAGAVLLGKTAVGALAYGDRWNRGRTRNPWSPLEGSGGSSAGSGSAVAAGLCAFAVGTETLGSIVNPAGRCGAVGLRPTHGRVSRRGAMALCWSLDKIGPIARGVADTAMLLDVMAGADAADAFQIPLPFGADLRGDVRGMRVGVVREDLDAAEAHPLDRAAVEAARGLGAELVELRRRELPWAALRGILSAEAAAAFEPITLDGRDDALARQDAQAWPNSFRAARFLSAVDHVQLDRLRRLAMEEMDRLFAGVDAVLGPAMTGPMLLITNFTGHPALCLPGGFHAVRPRPGAWEDEGAPGEAREVPHGICLWGRLFDEGPMLRLGAALEGVLGAAGRRPPEGEAPPS